MRSYDDIAIVEKEILASDLLVFASPVHWGNMSAIMLRTIERLFGFLIKEKIYGFPIAQQSKGKNAILVTACSTNWPFNYIFNQSRALFSRFHEVLKYSDIKVLKKYVLAGTNKKKEPTEADLKRARKIAQSV